MSPSIATRADIEWTLGALRPASWRMIRPGPHAGSEVEIGDAMGQALFQVVPLALAAALSSVPISATIFILLSEGRTRSGLAFLAGTVIGTLVAITLVAALGQALPGRPRHHAELIGKLEIALGIGMVLLGVFTLVRGSAASGSGPRWLNGVGSLGVLPVFGIGLALNLRPKAILLVVAAGLWPSAGRTSHWKRVLYSSSSTPRSRRAPSSFPSC